MSRSSEIIRHLVAGTEKAKATSVRTVTVAWANNHVSL